MEFQIFHNYGRLVRRGLASPLECRKCKNTPVVGINKETDEPVLKCLFCGTITEPGMNEYARMATEVEKHFGVSG